MPECIILSSMNCPGLKEMVSRYVRPVQVGAVLDDRPLSGIVLKDLSGRDSPVASCARVSIDLQGARKPLNRGYRK